MSPANDSLEAAARTASGVKRQPPFGAPYVFALVVIDGDDPAGIHRIARPETILGRGEGSHFAIEDELISKVHCRIRIEGPVCTILDPGSRNGTFVNGRRLAPNVAQRLKNLDEIEVGSHRLLLVTGRARARTQNAA